MTDQKTEQKTDEQRHLEAQAMQRLQMERLRDEFAMAALSGLLANPGGPIQASDRCGWDLTNCSTPDVVAFAYAIADEAMTARTQEAA